MFRLVSVILVAVSLSGCIDLGRQRPVIAVACPYIVAHDKEFQAKLADVYAKMTPEEKTVVKEWINLRDQSRACRKAGHK